MPRRLQSGASYVIGNEDRDGVCGKVLEAADRKRTGSRWCCHSTLNITKATYVIAQAHGLFHSIYSSTIGFQMKRGS